MKKSAQKVVILAVGIVTILIAGCEEPNLSNTKSNIKKHQLIATENRQLKKELEQRDKQIEKQKELHNKEIAAQKKLLDKCLQEKKALEELSSEGIEDFMDDILTSVAEENAKLRAENGGLKAQVEQLEARVQQLEKELQEIKRPGPRPLPSTPEPL